MVTARIAGLSPGTSPPPVRIPIAPFLVLMRPLCRFLRACKRKIDVSDWMCKRHRLDETVFCVTNSRYHANPSSDRVCFRRRCNDLTFQRITTGRPKMQNVRTDPDFPDLSSPLRTADSTEQGSGTDSLGNFAVILVFNRPNNRRDI